MTWVVPPPAFNGAVKPLTVEDGADSPSAEEPVVQLFAALHVAIPPVGTGPRQVTRAARRPARAGKRLTAPPSVGRAMAEKSRSALSDRFIWTTWLKRTRQQAYMS